LGRFLGRLGRFLGRLGRLGRFLGRFLGRLGRLGRFLGRLGRLGRFLGRFLGRHDLDELEHYTIGNHFLWCFEFHIPHKSSVGPINALDKS